MLSGLGLPQAVLSCFLQLLADPQLQLAGGLLREGDGDDLIDLSPGRARSAGRCGRRARSSCRCRRRLRRRGCRRAPRGSGSAARVVEDRRLATSLVSGWLSAGTGTAPLPRRSRERDILSSLTAGPSAPAGRPARPCSSSSRGVSSSGPHTGRKSQYLARAFSSGPRPGTRARWRGRRPRARAGPSCARSGSSCTVCCGEPAGLGAVIEPAGRHRLAGHLLDHEAVEHRLQRLPAVHRRRRPGAVLPRLVIGDAQRARRGVALDEIDRAAQDEPAVHRHGLASRCADRGPRRAAGRSDSSNRSGLQPSRHRPAASTHRRRSFRIAAISSRHTRSTAGASSSRSLLRDLRHRARRAPRGSPRGCRA